MSKQVSDVSSNTTAVKSSVSVDKLLEIRQKRLNFVLQNKDKENKQQIMLQNKDEENMQKIQIGQNIHNPELDTITIESTQPNLLANGPKCTPKLVTKSKSLKNVSKDTSTICIDLIDDDDDVIILDTPLKRKQDGSAEVKNKKPKLSDSIIILDNEITCTASQSYRSKLRRRLIPKVHTKDMACSPIVVAKVQSKFNASSKIPILHNASASNNNYILPLNNQNIPGNVDTMKGTTVNPYALMQNYLQSMISLVSQNILPTIAEEGVSSLNSTEGTIASSSTTAASATVDVPAIKASADLNVPANTNVVAPATITSSGTTTDSNDNYVTNVRCGNLYKNSGQFISENIHVDTIYRMEGLRPIVIDGSNIAMTYTLGKSFSVKGLKICIDFFLRRGHKVYAFIPSFRLRRNESDDPRLLQKLVNDELVFCTASRYLSNGRRICSYDDRILLQAAGAMNAVIVSQDRFRDVAQESYQLQNLIDNNLLIPTWCRGMIIFPADPFGRGEISLDDFLRFH